MSESPQEPSLSGLPPREKGLSGPATHALRRRLSRSIRMGTWALLLTGMALMSAHALTKAPHEDEGDLASAAASLLDRGRIAYPMSYMYLPSVRQEYHLLPPFYPASVAIWFAAFGRSLEAYRLFHVAWFVLLVVSWMQLVQTATVTRVALPIAAGLFALNYDLINLSVSRYDIVCAALNSAAMASFAVWRFRRFSLAVLVANCCLAMAALTHPYAIFGLIGCLSIFLAYGDWRRIRAAHVLIALVPYAVAFGVWARMIDGNWDIVQQEAARAARTKEVDFANPLKVFMEDSAVRWWQLFAGWRDEVPAIMRAKTLFFFLWGLMPFFLFRRAPGETLPLRIGIFSYCLVTLLVIPFTDNMHLQIYNVHIVVGFTALTAIVCADMWENRPRLRLPILAILSGICLFGALGIGLRVSKRDLQREYVPVHELLKRELVEGDIVIAPPEMGFGLAFERYVRVDPALTSVSADAMPRFIVESREQFGSTLYGVRCSAGSRVHDTTTYAVIPVHTPRNYYRILMRVAAGDSRIGGGQQLVHFARNCGAILPIEPRR